MKGSGFENLKTIKLLEVGGKLGRKKKKERTKSKVQTHGITLKVVSKLKWRSRNYLEGEKKMAEIEV